MPPDPYILLMGPRASGKTTLGAMLAQRLARQFIDLDSETLRTFTEQTIADAWRIHGEARWRDAEAAALVRALSNRQETLRARAVIALGGGTPMIPAAARRLSDAKRRREVIMVYLQCNAHTLMQRLRDIASPGGQSGKAGDGAEAGRSGGHRPPLIGTSAIDEVEEVLAQRESTYLGLADIVIDATDPDPTLTLERVLAALAQSPR